MEINGGIAKCSWGKENIDMGSGGGSSHKQADQNSAAATAAALAAAQSAASLQSGNNAWAQSGNNANWAASYQWAAAAGYPQNAATMNQYWQQQYPGYQNAMMQQQWGVMPPATSNGTNAQYQMGQYQQGSNGKS